MYNARDYIGNGCIYLNNALRQRHKVLSQLMLYATTRCQSRCRHCSIWEKEVEHLSLETIKKIMQSRCIGKHTTVGLEGGEFVLHPQAEEIMEWFMENHPNYTLLSNCLASKKVTDMVKAYKPKHLYVSLDGNRETYKRMRGVDGYDRVLSVVDAVKDVVPVSLMFCLSPWNGFDDMEFVIDKAGELGVDIRIGIYGTMAFFDTTSELVATNTYGNYIEQIPENICQTDENYDFVALYDEWKRGHLKLPCKSIFSELVVHSNGDVPLCQNFDIVLGNVYEKSLDEIFNSIETGKLQREYSQNCNGCWINFHRKYDIVLLRNFEKVLPKWIVEAILGKYQWAENDRESYKQHFSKIAKSHGMYK